MVASGLSILLLTTAPQLIHGLALPAGWKPQLGLPAGISLQNGFLGTEEDKLEAEADLSVTISQDESLWTQNAWTQYVDPDAKWQMTSFDRCVFIGTFGLLKAGELEASLERSDYYEETLALPLVGASCFNRWVVHGYVSETQRVCRSTDGINYGFWCLHTLETDRCTASKFCQTVLPSNGAMLQLTFEKGAHK